MLFVFFFFLCQNLKSSHLCTHKDNNGQTHTHTRVQYAEEVCRILGQIYSYLKFNLRYLVSLSIHLQRSLKHNWLVWRWSVPSVHINIFYCLSTALFLGSFYKGHSAIRRFKFWYQEPSWTHSPPRESLNLLVINAELSCNCKDKSTRQWVLVVSFQNQAVLSYSLTSWTFVDL